MAVNQLETVAPQTAPDAGGQPAQGEQPAIFTKYGGDWGKANEGYFEAVKMARESQQKAAVAEQLAEQNQQLQAALAQLVGAGGQPNDNDPFAAIQSELGLPADPLRNAVDSRVEAKLMEKLEGMFGPILGQIKADETLAAEIDNYDQLKGEARKFMAQNPEVSNVFNAVREKNPVAAWKYAIREALIAKGGRPGPQPVQHAGLPGGMGAGGGRGPAQPGGVTSEVKEKEALEYYYQGGTSSPYLKERFKGTSIERAVLDALRGAGISIPEGGTLPQGW